MPISVDSRAAPIEIRGQGLPAHRCLLDLANRSGADWQGRTLRIRHESAEWRRIKRARVSTTQFGDR